MVHFPNITITKYSDLHVSMYESNTACGSHVNDLATDGLSCSEGHHFRHSSLNDIGNRALSAAKLPAHLEPSGVGTVHVKQIGKGQMAFQW